MELEAPAVVGAPGSRAACRFGFWASVITAAAPGISPKRSSVIGRGGGSSNSGSRMVAGSLKGPQTVPGVQEEEPW